jgi:alpha-glucosidase (family GH31 glycosyl hydrolase)
MGPKPLDVIKQLKKLIRNPSLPPYWALGFHMCRTTCDLNDGINVIKQMKNNSVPLESDCGSSALSGISFRNSNDFKNLNDFYKKNKNETYKMKTIMTHVPQIKLNKTEGSAYMNWSPSALRAADNPNSVYNGFFWDWCESSSGIQKNLCKINNINL